MTIVAVVLLVGAAWAFWPSGTANREVATDIGSDMEILPAQEDVALTPSVDSVFRVQAEASARQVTTIALQVYAEMGDFNAVTPDLMRQFDPAMHFIDGSQNSTGPQVVSMRANGAGVVFAIAAEGEICVFSRVDVQMAAANVAAKTSTCNADFAPASGWAAPGGAVSGGGLGVDPMLTDPAYAVDPGIIDT